MATKYEGEIASATVSRIVPSSVHYVRQLAKLPPDFVFAIGILEVAAGAFSQARNLTPISERDGDSCRLEAWHAGVELGIFANGDFAAERPDRGISHHVFREGVMPHGSPENQRSA
jgi:hypothetical protein